MVGVSHLISLEYQNWVRDQEANFASGVSVDIQSLNSPQRMARRDIQN